MQLFMLVWSLGWSAQIPMSVAGAMSEGGFAALFALLFFGGMGGVASWVTLHMWTHRTRVALADGRLTRRCGPVPPFGAWSVDRGAVDAVLVTDRWTDSGDGPCVEWIVAIRGQFDEPKRVFPTGGHTAGETPTLIEALARELSELLELPVVCAKRDERPVARAE